MRMNNMKIWTRLLEYSSKTVIVSAICCAGLSFAKGMNEIKPDPESNAEETQEKDQDGKAEPIPAPLPEVDDAAVDDDASAVEKATAPIVRSEISKKISEKLFITTALGVGSLSKGGEQWGSGLNTQILIGYYLPFDIAGFPISAHYRYMAFDVTHEYKDHSYRGVVESHMFGASGWLRLGESMVVLAGAELGMFLAHNRTLDQYPKDKAVDDSGFGLALFGGTNWRFLEKIDLGPRLRVAFGSFTQVEIGGAASFIF